MNSNERTTDRISWVRLGLLAVVGVVVANLLGALLFSRDEGLGVDELWVALAGLGFAVAVELGLLFRRRP